MIRQLRPAGKYRPNNRCSIIYTLQQWQFLIAVCRGWVHQRQTEIIVIQNDQITTLLRALREKRSLCRAPTS